MKGFQKFDDIYWKYMLSYKKRTVFTILGIMLAVILFFGAGTIYTSVYKANYETNKDIYGDYEAAGTVNPEEYQRLKKLDYVQSVLLSDTKDQMFIELDSEELQMAVLTYLESYDQSVFSFALVEGRYPESSQEAILDEYIADFIGVQTGDMISLYENEYWYGDICIGGVSEAYEYVDSHTDKDENGNITNDSITMEDLERKKAYTNLKITGIYDSTDTFYGSVFIEYAPIMSLIDKEQNYTNLNAYVQFKNHENHIKELASEEGIYLAENSEITMYLPGYSQSELDGLLQYILFMIAFAILFWIAVIIIRNVFVMTMAERGKDYGILRCMGISQYHLRRLLCKEGLAMAAIACVLGMGITTIFLEFGKYIGGFKQLLSSLGIYKRFHVSISWWVVLGSIGFTLCAVLFSLLEPARQIGAIAPVDAIIGRKTIKKEKFKRRRSGLIRRLLGVEGEYAYKNVLRNKGKFIASIVGIAVSVVGLMISFDLIHIADKIMEMEVTEGEYDAYAVFRNGKGKDNEDVKEFEADLLALESVEEIRSCYYKYMHAGKEYGLLTNRTGEKPSYTDYLANGFDEKQVAELESVLLEGELDYEALKEGGVIICRSVIKTSYIGGEESKMKIQETDLQAGDRIWIPKGAMNYDYGADLTTIVYNEDGTLNEDNVIICPVIAVIDYNPNSVSEMPDVIFAREFYQEYVIGENTYAEGFQEIRVKCSENYNTEEMYEFGKTHKRYIFNDYGYHEAKEAGKGMQQLIIMIAMIIVGIGAVNSFNTLSSNISLRKQEFQVMNAVGMSRKQILKMLSLEGGLSAIIGSLAGIGVGGIVGFWLTAFAKELCPTMVYQIPWMGIGLAIILAIVITLTSMLIAKRELKTWEE